MLVYTFHQQQFYSYRKLGVLWANKHLINKAVTQEGSTVKKQWKPVKQISAGGYVSGGWEESNPTAKNYVYQLISNKVNLILIAAGKQNAIAVRIAQNSQQPISVIGADTVQEKRSIN